jgi:uncharacterized ferritin-like protein (DUF455 family)
MQAVSIIDAAIRVLTASDPAAKTIAAHQMFERWQLGELALPVLETGTAPLPIPDFPGRPDRPELVNPRDLKRRRLGSVEGRISLLHAIAHIEFNAINLAADMVARYAMDIRIQDDNRLEFVSDWVSVCNDEARHFSMIQVRLKELSSSYGDFPAHNGLWEAAISTKDDLAARLVIAPMVLEARGLDVTPKMIENLQKFGDDVSAKILTTIFNEEIGHVAAGARWFRHICERENQQENPYFQALLATHFKGSLKPPFNVEARNLAGLSRSFYEPKFVEN